MHKVPDSIPRAERSVVVAYACDSSTEEVEAGGSDLLLHNEFKPVWDAQDPGKQASKQRK